MPLPPREQSCPHYLHSILTACVYGDPHIVTLDGFKYTFNGAGEYVLIATPSDQFSLQGRMEVPTGLSIEGPIRATVFTAVAAKEAWSDTVQMQLTSDRQSLEMLVNGELVDFEELPEQELNNVTVADRGNDALSARFSSGVYVEVRERNGILSTLLVSLSPAYRGQTTGLMGNFNGDTLDDLAPRPATNEVPPPIPLNSSLDDIHNMFGVTCEITANDSLVTFSAWTVISSDLLNFLTSVGIVDRSEDSLFTYEGETSFLTYFNPRFLPTFIPRFPSDELEAQAVAMCMGDQFCLFDIAATSSADIGLSTLQGNLEFENIVNISLPGEPWNFNYRITLGKV